MSTPRPIPSFTGQDQNGAVFMEFCPDDIVKDNPCQLHVVAGQPPSAVCEHVPDMQTADWSITLDDYNKHGVLYLLRERYPHVCLLQPSPGKYSVFAIKSMASRAPDQAAAAIPQALVTDAGQRQPAQDDSSLQARQQGVASMIRARLRPCAPLDKGKTELSDVVKDAPTSKYLAEKLQSIWSSCVYVSDKQFAYYKLDRAQIASLIALINADIIAGKVREGVDAEALIRGLKDLNGDTTWAAVKYVGSALLVVLVVIGLPVATVAVMRNSTTRSIEASRKLQKEGFEFQAAEREKSFALVREQLQQQLQAMREETDRILAAQREESAKMIAAMKEGTNVDPGKFLRNVTEEAKSPNYSRLVGCVDELKDLVCNSQTLENSDGTIKRGPMSTVITTEEDMSPQNEGSSAGGGKTALRKAFFHRVATGQIPELNGYQLYELDTTSLEAAGAKFVGMGGAVADSLIKAMDANESPQAAAASSSAPTPSCGPPETLAPVAQARPCIVGISELHTLLGMFQTEKDAHDFLDKLLTRLEDRNKRSFLVVDTNKPRGLRAHEAFARRMAWLWHKLAGISETEAIVRASADDLTSGTGVRVSTNAVRATVHLANACKIKWPGAMPSNALALLEAVIRRVRIDGSTGEITEAQVVNFVAEQVHRSTAEIGELLSKAKAAQVPAVAETFPAARTDLWGRVITSPATPPQLPVSEPAAPPGSPAPATPESPAVSAAPADTPRLPVTTSFESGMEPFDAPPIRGGSCASPQRTVTSPARAVVVQQPAAPSASIAEASPGPAVPPSEGAQGPAPSPEAPPAPAPQAPGGPTLGAKFLEFARNAPLNKSEFGVTAAAGVAGVMTGYGACYAYSRATGEEMPWYAKHVTFITSNLAIAYAGAKMAKVPFSWGHLLRSLPVVLPAGVLSQQGASIALSEFAGLDRSSHANGLLSGLMAAGIVSAGVVAAGGMAAVMGAGIIAGGLTVLGYAALFTAVFAVSSGVTHGIDEGIGWAIKKTGEAVGARMDGDYTITGGIASLARGAEKLFGIDEAMYKFWKWTGVI